jgi:CBS domain-containing protein
MDDPGRCVVQNYTVNELMVPISEYATVPVGTTLFEAVLALEKAQEEYDHTKYRHRGVLILDVNKQVVGKLSQLDVLRALEPVQEGGDELNELFQYGFSSGFIRSLQNERRLKGAPLKDLCRKASELKVEDFMQAPTEADCVDHELSLEVAVQQLALGDHLGLLVTREKKIVGILRLTDVFAAVSHSMKECDITD